MNKLMVTVAVAMFGIAASAASFTWGYSGYDYTGPNGEGATTVGSKTMMLYDAAKVFLYYGTVTASDTAFDFSEATYVISGTYDSSKRVYGTASKTALASSSVIPDTEAGHAYTLIVVDDASVTSLDNYEGNYVLMTGESEKGTIAGTTPTYYGKYNLTGFTQSDWKTMSVPEPTSAMLLLLGMAGLALRRRQA